MLHEFVLTWGPYTDTILQSLPLIYTTESQIWRARMSIICLEISRCMFHIVLSTNAYTLLKALCSCLQHADTFDCDLYRLIKFKTKDISIHFWRSICIGNGDHSLLNYSTCWCTYNLHSHCSLWAIISNILRKFRLDIKYVICSSNYV